MNHINRNKMSLIHPSANVLTRVLSPRVYPILWKSSIIDISLPFYDLHNAALARYPAPAAFMACLASSLLSEVSVTTILDCHSKPCIPGLELDRVADGHLLREVLLMQYPMFQTDRPKIPRYIDHAGIR